MTTQVKAQHTPGPWMTKQAAIRVDGEYDYAVIADGQVIAEAFGRSGVAHFHNVEANARLIATAPALLAVLKAISDDAVGDQLDPLWIVQREVITAARVVIAKAEGQL